MTWHAGLIDELERDLGLAARLRVLANAGGQRRYIPKAEHVETSKLAKELGVDVCFWLAGRWGGEEVHFPSQRGSDVEEKASRLRATVLDAGLTDPARSANDIAAEFGVTVRRVRQLRAELRGDLDNDPSVEALPLFRRS